MNSIAATREAAGITQAALYRKLGWRQSRLANYESGSRGMKLKAARQIVTALNELGAACDLDQVFPSADLAQATTQTIRPLVAPRQCDESAVNSSSNGDAQ